MGRSVHDTPTLWFRIRRTRHIKNGPGEDRCCHGVINEPRQPLLFFQEGSRCRDRKKTLRVCVLTAWKYASCRFVFGPKWSGHLCVFCANVRAHVRARVRAPVQARNSCTCSGTCSGAFVGRSRNANTTSTIPLLSPVNHPRRRSTQASGCARLPSRGSSLLFFRCFQAALSLTLPLKIRGFASQSLLTCFPLNRQSVSGVP